MNKKLKCTALLILLSFIFKSCYNTSRNEIMYQVIGTKKDVSIKYRGVTYEGIIDEELTTVKIDKLPFSIGIMESKKKSFGKINPWFISANSDSEGYMTVIIHIYKPYNAPYERVSKTTTKEYAEVSGKWDD